RRSALRGRRRPGVQTGAAPPRRPFPARWRERRWCRPNAWRWRSPAPRPSRAPTHEGRTAMPAKKRIVSPKVPEPPPRTWSNCLKIGNQVLIAGMTCREGAVIVGGDSMYGQSKAVFAKIANLLKAAGATMDDVVKINVFVTDIARR